MKRLAGEMAPKRIVIPGDSEPVESFRRPPGSPQLANIGIFPGTLPEVSILDGSGQGFRGGFENDCRR